MTADIVFIVWGALGLAGWWWLLRRTPGGLGSRAPVGQWNVVDGIFAGVVVLLIIARIATPDPPDSIVLTTEMMQGGILNYAFLVALFAFVAFGRGQTPQVAFGLAPTRPLNVVLMGAVCMALAYPLVSLVGSLMGLLGAPVSEMDPMVNYLAGKPDSAGLAWAFVLVVIVAPCTEEFIFRGYLYGVMKKFAGRPAAIAASALLFAGIHPNLPGIPVLFVLALALTLTYELTGSLWSSIVMHAIFNLVSFVGLVYFPEWALKP